MNSIKSLYSLILQEILKKKTDNSRGMIVGVFCKKEKGRRQGKIGEKEDNKILKDQE